MTRETKPLELTDDDVTKAAGGHKDWIIIQSMSSPIFRSIPEGATDGETSTTDAATDDMSMTLNFEK